MAKNCKQFSIEVDNYKTLKVVADSDNFVHIASLYRRLCGINKNSEFVFYLYDNKFGVAIYKCYKGMINVIN